MTATPVTATSGAATGYSDAPVVVGPVRPGFAATLNGALAATSPSIATQSAGSINTATTRGGSFAPLGGSNAVTLGQMVQAAATGTVSPLGPGTPRSLSPFPAAGAVPGTMPGSVPGAMTSTMPSGAPSTGRAGASAPAELVPYGNGRIPLEMLTPIGIGGHRLYAPAAQSFMAMRAAAAAEGVDVGITDSYRTYDQQVDLAQRKGLYSQGGYAAVPGTSKHGWGMAIDIDVDATGQAWMRANAARFGFVENVPREPWHWEFVGTTAA